MHDIILADEIICSVEAVIKDLPSDKVEEIKTGCSICIRNAKLPKSDLSPDKKLHQNLLKKISLE